MNHKVIEFESGSASKEALELNPAVFDKTFNEGLVHQVIVSYQANGRAQVASQLSRGQVAMTTKKQFRQKGTGNARSGACSTNIKRGGGVAFGTNGRSHDKKINKRMYTQAIACLLSRQLKRSRLLIVQDFMIQSAKTKDFRKVMSDRGLSGKVLMIDDVFSESFLRASANLYACKLSSVYSVSPVDLYHADFVLMSKSAVEKVAGWLA